MSVDASPIGEGLLWGGAVPHPECAGYGVVYFAEKALRGMGDSLIGKRCAITGSGKVCVCLSLSLPLSLSLSVSVCVCVSVCASGLMPPRSGYFSP